MRSAEITVEENQVLSAVACDRNHCLQNGNPFWFARDAKILLSEKIGQHAVPFGNSIMQ